MTRLFPFLQLVRFPNVFVLLADILTVAFLLTSLELLPAQNLVPFIAAGVGAVCLYWAGMILNDAFDFLEDSVLRPERPLPSGRIALPTAIKTGWGLLAAGWVLCFLAGIGTRNLTSALSVIGIATVLRACIVMYDARLKNTPMGPFLMGLCRGLNVLLFLAFMDPEKLNAAVPLFLYPMALTVFITGVTFYARNETQDAPEAGIRRPGVGMMVFSVLLLVGGVAILLPFPTQLNAAIPGIVQPLFMFQPWRWPTLLGVLAIWLAFRAVTAYFQDETAVRRVVKQALFLVFLLDAGLTLVVAGIPHAMVILALFVLASLIGRWIYST
ncbi:MAG: UbiA family prenyltransferase [Thermoguttaceae bacterium]|nr:UbiA family prenyltransferase [Thermoguttaceae bacterium]